MEKRFNLPVLFMAVFVFTALCSLPCRVYAGNYRQNSEMSFNERKKESEAIGKSATLPDTKGVIKKVLLSPEELRVPENAGSVKETWAGVPGSETSGRPIVIHIQDAHCNYEAQSNISRILDTFMKEYPDQIKLVAVEGSVGVIDTSPFAEFSDKEIKKEVADYFMKKGKITGPEFLSITGDRRFTIYGIENKDLYDRNYKAFMDSLPFREESGKYCGYLQKVLTQLKAHIYSRDLREYDKELISYREGDTGFLDYTSTLRKWAEKEHIGLSGYKNFALLREAQGIENKVDFDVVDRERTRLIDRLGAVLPKKELSALVVKSLHFRLGKITSAEYYKYLKDIMDKNGGKIREEDYPNLCAYIDYVKIHYSMDKTKLFDECGLLEERIAGALFRNGNERRLFKLSRHIGILRRMFKLELVKDDYRYYKKNKADFRAEAFLDFIRIQAPRFGIAFQEDEGIYKIDDNLPVIEEFYEAAIARDPVLIDNMLAEMKTEGVKVCVLIAGGFHTKGLMDILKDRQIAYAVISPRITKKQEHNPYIDVMTNKKTPFEEFLEQLGTE